LHDGALQNFNEMRHNSADRVWLIPYLSLNKKGR
jgi:hypothetical protein